MSRCRILIVDDEAVALRVLRVGLERGGYQVDSAANGQQALAAILEAPPDALITDIEMPMMSGEELCARL
ncbi:MAG: response regulator, partial [Gammaproteobacteria bacterium]|nr:response regulator [Gammaproteobacteria bacterium]